MKLVSKLTVLAAVIGIAIWWAAAEPGTAGGEGRLALPPAPRMPLLGPGETYHGVAWQIHDAASSVEQARIMLNEIADLGADTVVISNAGYQEHAGSATFEIKPEVTPTPEQWRAIFQIAHENGLRVILMPLVLLSDPRGTEWRGRIEPPSWDEWFDQYRRFLAHFARLAADGKVEVLMVGSELVSTEKYTQRWRQTIKTVREYYPGKLSYSANWDHYKVIQFWDDLDLVGMTSYYKLASEEKPSLESLIDAWKPIRRGLLRWRERIGKPLLFTEAGWCSQEGASIEPWNYYYKQEATEGGLDEQRKCYQAFMKTFEDDIWPQGASGEPVVGGVVWWEWTNTPGGEDDYNYTPRGKPAERDLRKWFGSIREKRTRLAARIDPALKPDETADERR